MEPQAAPPEKNMPMRNEFESEQATDNARGAHMDPSLTDSGADVLQNDDIPN
jgi:hypothetical protein